MMMLSASIVSAFLQHLLGSYADGMILYTTSVTKLPLLHCRQSHELQDVRNVVDICNVIPQYD